MASWQPIVLSALVVVFTVMLVLAVLQTRQRSRLLARSVLLDATAARPDKPRKIDRDEVMRHLPNALDLLRVCIDAGLDLNASMGRVGTELRESCPSLSLLFSDVQLQLSAGATREQAFDSFAAELRSIELRNLMMSLAEAERLGSSISAILKTYSAELRLQRQLRAEEYGAKLPTKLLFPMLVCLFPAMLVVLAGPSIIAGLELVKMLR